MYPVAQPQPPQESALLGRVAAGDQVAVRELVARYGGLVWSIARRFDANDAEDAVQEIFLDLWKNAARFDPSIASETAFVAMITRRRLIDRRRMRRRHDARIEPVTELPVVMDEASQPDTCAEAKQAARALSQLRPEQQQVLVMSTCHGMSHGEIAEQTGMPLGTVKAHARRGLLSIRAALLGVEQEELR